MEFNRKINSGFIDLFYTFKFKNKKDYSKINEILEEMNCVISEIVDKSIGFNCNYEEYLQFCVSEINKKNVESINKSNIKLEGMQIKARHEFTFDFSKKYKTNILDDEIAVTVSGDGSNSLLSKYEYRTYEHIFLEQKMLQLTTYLNENFIGLNIDKFLKIYVLQPIKVENSNENIDEKYINIYLWLYSSGCVTIQFTVPISNSIFGNWTQPEQNPFILKTKLPLYIENNKSDEEYIYSDKEYDYEEGINIYIQYIIKKLNKVSTLEKHNSELKLFTLIDYEDSPTNFDSMPAKNSIVKDLFWIVHSPFGYLNEVTKTKYNKFLENRYEISKYASVFAGTQGKIVIAWNNSTRDLPEEVRELIYNRKYSILMSYVIIPIHELLMKTTYCNSILNKQFNRLTSKKDIIKRQEDIIYIKDYVFSLKRYSYESSNSMSNYLQSTLSNFLKNDALNERINFYKDIIELKDSEENEKNNFILSISSVIVALLLGVDAIDKLTQLIKNTFGMDWTNYNFKIWGCLLILLIMMFIYLRFKHKLKCICNLIKIKFNQIINVIKKYLPKF